MFSYWFSVSLDEGGHHVIPFPKKNINETHSLSERTTFTFIVLSPVI